MLDESWAQSVHTFMQIIPSGHLSCLYLRYIFIQVWSPLSVFIIAWTINNKKKQPNRSTCLCQIRSPPMTCLFPRLHFHEMEKAQVIQSVFQVRSKSRAISSPPSPRPENWVEVREAEAKSNSHDWFCSRLGREGPDRSASQFPF